MLFVIYLAWMSPTYCNSRQNVIDAYPYLPITQWNTGNFCRNGIQGKQVIFVHFMNAAFAQGSDRVLYFFITGTQEAGQVFLLLYLHQICFENVLYRIPPPEGFPGDRLWTWVWLIANKAMPPIYTAFAPMAIALRKSPGFTSPPERIKLTLFLVDAF